ncbi:MAG TPA: AAA family ATPase [Phenylobacterium sp.]
MGEAAPTLHVLAGPNGAGKTSFYESWLRPRTGAEFVNADLLVHAALGRYATTQADATLGQRLAEDRRAALIASRQSLVTESTFSHPSKLHLLRHARAGGYRVIVYHVNVDSSDLAVARVAAREAHGGHPVPEDRIRGRYLRNQALIRDAVRMADRAFVIDNSVRGSKPSALIAFSSGSATEVAPELPPWAATLYADDLSPRAQAKSAARPTAGGRRPPSAGRS